MKDEIEAAERELARAFAVLQPGRTMREGGAKAEGLYGQAYHRLVVLGARPPLRAKYRAR